MGAGECSNSKPCEPSASSQAAGGAWAKLVPADSAYPEVEVAEDDAVVCSLVAPAGGEELAWCEIRRGGDASSATIRNLSSDAIIVDGRVIQEEAVDIKPGSEIVPGPQKEGYLVYTFDITAAKDHDKNNIKIVLDVENAKCSICLNLWHDVVTVAPCFHNFCNGCFSEWLRRSSTNSCDKSQSAACPQCRTAVQSVGRNHFLHNIEEAILQAFSSLQRSDEEIALLESYASVKSNLVPPRRAAAGRGHGRGPLPPPPPVHPTLAQVMAQQTRLLEAIASSQRTGAASQGSRFREFMRTKPPIFSSADEPLEAEDWLRTIEKKLTLARCCEEDKVLFATQLLAGPAADWWDNYLAARVGEEPEVTAAAEEEEVAEDEEADKTLLLENKRKTFEASCKRKMGTSRAPTPSHRPFYIAPSSSGAQPTALPRATAPANRPSGASYATPVRPSQPQQVGTAPANLVCFKCGGTGHYARNCTQQPMTPVRFNINTPARPPSTPGTAVRGRPLTSSAPRTASFQGQGRVNHINAEEAQEAPEVQMEFEASEDPQTNQEQDQQYQDQEPFDQDPYAYHLASGPDDGEDGEA